MAIDPLREKLEEAADRADAAAVSFFGVLTADRDTPVPVEGGATVDSMSKRIYDQVATQVDSIEQSASDSVDAAAASKSSATASAASAVEAKASEDKAALEKDAAITASTNAQSSATNAQASAAQATASATAAAASESTVAADATRASAAADDAESEAANALASKNAAATSATQAAASATQSANSAAASLASSNTASGFSANADNKAEQARVSSVAAATSATQAAASAASVSTGGAAAQASANDAAASATQATAASTSANTARDQAVAAKTSAESAATSASASNTSALGHANDAEDSALASQASAVSSAGYATTAQSSANASSRSADDSLQHANASQASSNAASQSASNALNSATASVQAATKAQISANDAQSSASAAAQSAIDAENAAAGITASIEYARYSFDNESSMVTDGAFLPDGSVSEVRETGFLYKKTNGVFSQISATNDLKSILSYETIDEAEAAAAMLPDDKIIQVEENNSLYVVNGGELSFKWYLNRGSVTGRNVVDYGAKAGADSTAAFVAAGSAFVPDGEYTIDGSQVGIAKLIGGPRAFAHYTTGGRALVNGLAAYEEFSQIFWDELVPSPGTTLARNAVTQAIGICDEQVIMAQNVSSPNGIWAANSVVRFSLFPLSRRSSDTWDVVSNAGATTPISVVDLTGMGHGSGASLINEGGKQWLYSTLAANTIPVDGIGCNYGTGYTKIEWKGSGTTQADVREYRGLKGVFNAEVCVSSDGKLLVFAGYRYFPVIRETSAYYQTVPWISVFNRAEVEAASDPATIEPVASFRCATMAQNGVGYGVGANLAGIASDGRYVYALHSGAQVVGARSILMYSLKGDVVKAFPFDGMAAIDPAAYRTGASDGQLCTSYEVEGLAFYKDALVSCSKFNFSQPTAVVSYRGKNFTPTAASTNVTPTNFESWARTEAPASGAWNATTAYAAPATGTFHKYLTALVPSSVYDREHPVSGVIYPDSPAQASTGVDSSGLVVGSNLFVSTYDRNTDTFFPLFDVRNSGIARLYQASYLMNNPDYDPVNYFGRLAFNYASGITLSAGTSVDNGATISLGTNRTSDDREIVFFSRGTRSFFMRDHNYSYKNLYPTTTAAFDIGQSSQRWNNIYLSTAPNVSSDERVKSGFRLLTAAEKAAALEIKNTIGLFQLNDAIEKKGEEKARWHAGVKAQQVVGILRGHGLNPFDYAWVCYDEWDAQPESVLEWGDEYDDDGTLIRSAGSEVTLEAMPAGSMYSIRYEQLAMFIIAAI